MTNEKGTEMLRQIADYYGISKNSDFAKFFDLTIQTAFQRMKNGFVDFEQIYARCPDISPDWMLSGGQGPMLRKDRDKEIAARVAESGKGVAEEKNIEQLQVALDKAQDALARSQSQVSDLIALLKAQQR